MPRNLSGVGCSGGNGAVNLEITEHAFGAVRLTVEALAVADRLRAI